MPSTSNAATSLSTGNSFGQVSTNPGVSTPAFVLGGIVFTGTEVPEQLNDLGGDQLLAVHEFPGGQRTLQSLGAFPPPEIHWTGLLVGPTAFSRSFAIDRLRVAGAPINLSYGGWVWNGVLRSYLATVVNEWLVRYHAVFVPSVDLATPPAVPNVSASVNQFRNALAGLGENLPVTLFGISLPSAVVQPLQNLYGAASQAIEGAGGKLEGITSIDIQNINTLAGQAYQAGNALMSTFDITQPEASESDAVLTVLSYAGIIQTLANGAAETSVVLHTVNPNLYQIAAQYLNDSSRWTVIADLNGLADPMPIGEYTLNVPSVTNMTALPSQRFA